MWPPGYHHNGLVATHALGHMMHCYTLFMITCMLYPSCFCDIWALCVSWITLDHLYYAPCLPCWALLVHWYQHCVTVQAIVVTTRRTHCFHDYMYIYIYKYIYIYIHVIMKRKCPHAFETLWSHFVDGVQLPQGYTATLWGDSLIFTRDSWYSVDQSRKDKRLWWPWIYPLVLNLCINLVTNKYKINSKNVKLTQWWPLTENCFKVSSQSFLTGLS